MAKRLLIRLTETCCSKVDLAEHRGVRIRSFLLVLIVVAHLAAGNSRASASAHVLSGKRAWWQQVVGFWSCEVNLDPSPGNYPQKGFTIAEGSVAPDDVFHWSERASGWRRSRRVSALKRVDIAERERALRRDDVWRLQGCGRSLSAPVIGKERDKRDSGKTCAEISPPPPPPCPRGRIALAGDVA